MIGNSYNIYKRKPDDKDHFELENFFECSLIVNDHSRDTNFIMYNNGGLQTGFSVGIRSSLQVFKECNSLREQMMYYDDLFELIGDEPIIYTIYDKDDSLYKIALLDSFGMIYLFYPSLNTIYSTTKYRKDVSNLYVGKHSQHYTIINDFDSVKDALMSDEMLTYEDVLNSI